MAPKFRVFGVLLTYPSTGICAFQSVLLTIYTNNLPGGGTNMSYRHTELSRGGPRMAPKGRLGPAGLSGL